MSKAKSMKTPMYTSKMQNKNENSKKVNKMMYKGKGNIWSLLLLLSFKVSHYA